MNAVAETTKHTPGPWMSKWNGVYGAQVLAGGVGLALVGGGNGVQMANAHLIAAAPELLAMVQVFAQMMRDGANFSEDRDLRVLTLAAVEAVLAKAEGASR
jgi:hypothetical protein